ncbi:Bacterial transferase hexapeptide (six repeats) family protein [Acanthocheilonema viteae]
MTVENRFTIASDAVVCKEAILKGDITIGSGTVVHPTAVIRATNGPIIIGENNNIEETCVIENLNENGQTLSIGRDNVFEIGSVVHAPKIGDNNVFGVRCKVGPNTTVTRGCFIGVNCVAMLQEELPENTVIYGKNNSRRVARDPPQLQTSQLEYLRKAFERFHYFIKSSQ